MSKVSLRLAAVAACFATAGCTEKLVTLAEGTPSSLDVVVYVDADGDGMFDGATDVPIADITVTATPSSGGGEPVVATTNASGLAAFAQLSPGSYSLSAAGTVPSGAVLASASSPVVVAPFQGAELASQFRYTFNPGQLSIVVYRDDNGSGSFEPGIDTPAGGVGAELAAGSEVVGTGTTDANGTVGFETLRPGEYILTLTPLPTIDLVGGNTRTIVIGAAVTTDVEVEFTGNLVLPIVDARAAANGETVAVEGVVSWQAQFRTTLDGFMQDGTAGITLFDFGQSAVQIGDSIRVIGTKGAFRGEVQISPVTSVEVLANVGEPTPRPVTASEINAGQFQSELVTITGTVDSLQVFSFDNHNVWLTDGAGDQAFVFVDSRVGVGSADWTVGLAYAVTGVLSADDRNAFPYRMELRGPGDMVLAEPIVNVADARTMVGSDVTVEGVVTWQQQWDSRVYYFQDATGGVGTFDFGNIPFARGDLIRVRGTVSSFRGEIQLSPVSSRAVVSSGAAPAARVVTAPEIIGGMFQGELVTIAGTVDSMTVDGFDNASVYLSDGNGDDFLVFTDSRTGVASTVWTVGNAYTVTGVLTTDNRFVPNIPAARLETRDAADIVAQ